MPHKWNPFPFTSQELNKLDQRIKGFKCRNCGKVVIMKDGESTHPEMKVLNHILKQYMTCEEYLVYSIQSR